MDDKQLKLQEIKEYLAEQKQIRNEYSEMKLANSPLSTIETHSSFEEVPENIELVSLMGENRH